MSPLRLTGSTSGYSQIDAPAVAGDQTFTLPGTGGVVDTRNRAGNILQVVNATYSTQVSSNSTTFVDTGLSATITPTLASSKILVIVHHTGAAKFTSDVSMYLKLLRGSTDLAWIERVGGYTGTTGSVGYGSCSLSYLDNPATTSGTTYKTQFASNGASSEVRLQCLGAGTSPTSTITLLEVAA